MACCRCNSSGQCRNCVCVKNKKTCTNCLPSKRNHCHNRHNQREDQQPVTNEISEATQDHDHIPDWSEQLSAMEGNPAIPPLLTFEKMSNSEFKWGTVEDSASFIASVEDAYKEIVFWRQNQFMLSTGKAGEAFICELAKCLSYMVKAPPLERIALKCAMILPSLILQKPHSRSRSADHVKAVHRRMQRWKNGEILDLLHEGRTIQQRLPERSQKSDEKFVKVFTSLMFRGKVRAAIRLLNKQANSAGILSLNDLVEERDTPKSVRDILREKHPDGEPAHQDAILASANVNCPDVHPVIFESIDALAIKQAALRVTGAAGPSGTDAQAWKHFVTAFGAASDDLCSALACMARRIATSHVDPED